MNVNPGQTVVFAITNQGATQFGDYVLTIDDSVVGPTPSSTSTATSTPSSTSTATSTPSSTSTATSTPTATSTGTPPPTSTQTSSPTVTPTIPAPPTSTATPTPTTVSVGTVSGRVFNDLNANGVQNLPGEVGLSGVSVTLTGPGVNQTRALQALTNANGDFSFANVPFGSFTLAVTPPPGFTLTTPNNVLVTVNGPVAVQAQFGLNQSGVPTPVIPEPSVVALFGSGLLALGWLAHRRRRR